jgi:CheY-like chemotaxis protein
MAGKNVLIIDDSRADIELATVALEATGRELSLSSAMDGPSALAMLREGNELPYLVLLDLKMTGMDGIDILREIRSDAHLKELPVVVVTSSSLESDKEEAIAAGASDFLLKPLSLPQFSEDLGLIVDRWLPN